MAARTDVHRPAALVTEDYDYLGSYDMGGPDTMDGSIHQQRINLINSVLEQGYRFVNPSAGDCGHCGHQGLRYVALMLHIPTGTVIRVGETCLENRFERATADFHELRRRAQLDREAQHVKAAREAFLADNPELAALTDLPADAHYILHDLAAGLRRYGSLTERQIPLAIKLLAEAAAPASVEPPAVPIPDDMIGKVTLTATVLGTKWQDGPYGSTFKALLAVPHGAGQFKVWSTVPAAEHGDGDSLKGRTVRWIGTLKRAERFGVVEDPTFGIFTRPRVAK